MKKPQVYLAGALNPSHNDYIRFHLNEVGIGLTNSVDAGPLYNVAQNRTRILLCDMVMFNFLHTNGREEYVELGWADAFRKPCILIASTSNSDDPYLETFKIAKQICAWHVNDIDSAIRIIGETLLS